MRIRYIKEVGTQALLRIYWDTYRLDKIDPCDQCPEGHRHSTALLTCPNAHGHPGYHDAQVPLKRVDQLEAWRAFGDVEDYPEEMWPKACKSCGAAVPAHSPPTVEGATGPEVTRQVFTKRLYDTTSGNPEPGDVFERLWHDPGECPYWDNCNGIHLYCILPNDSEWDIDSRASNCTLRDERTHRCWVRKGTAQDQSLDVSKDGHTCQAGAGSIAVTGWHGFLRNGHLVA